MLHLVSGSVKANGTILTGPYVSHIRSHRYCCPRCAALTCSLPCVKRHKQWAQCNGVRNPAAYVKQSDLATPAGIDRDYNYLTSIEREFDKAEREATSRGVFFGKGKRHQAVKGEANLKTALETLKIIVAKAPKGMSRNKANKTRWLKGEKCIEWTVEWVHPDGMKESAQCKETVPIEAAYEGLVNRMKRKPGALGETVTSHGAADGNKKLKRGKRARIQERKARNEQRTGTASIERSSTEPSPSLKLENESDFVKGSNTDNNETVVHNGHGKICHPNVQASHQNGAPKDEESLSRQSDRSFYLHTPSLPSRRPVLAQIPHDATLRTALHNRLVLEYPTVYVFGQPPDDPLPNEFITEEEFYKSARKELVEELDEEEGEIVEFVPKKDEEVRSAAAIEDLDEKRLLEILRKDLGTA